MNCLETKALLPEYVEGALAEVRRREVEAHLSGCSSCSAALAQARSLDTFLRGALPVPEPPADYWAKQEARALQAAARPVAQAVAQRRGVPKFVWGLGIAAALVVAVGVFGLTRPSPTATPPDRESAKEAQAPGSSKLESPTPPVAPPDPERTPSPSPSPGAATAVLPGHADYVERLTDEIIQVGLAETASDRVLGLIKAADGRMSELRAAMAARDEAMAEDLAAAYTMIYREGIKSVLADREAEAEDLATARVVARKYAGWKVEAIAKLEPEARGSLKAALHDALLATREIAAGQ